MHTLFDVIDHTDVPVVIGAVDEGKFEGGAGVAAIKDYEEGAAWGETRDEMFVEGVAVYLAALFEIDWDDCVEDAGWVAACWILDLGAIGC